MLTTADDLFDGWGEAARAILGERLRSSAAEGRLDGRDVAAIVEGEGGSQESVMLRLLPVARAFARPPISQFRVGAVLLGTSGALYLGANIEVGGEALNQCVHAEQSAVANAFAHRERGVAAIAVTAAPCGHCRQFLNEIDGGSQIRILVDGEPPRNLGDLLPASFGPRDLGIEAGLLTTDAVAMQIGDASDPVVRAALEAASRAYAPHSRSRSGCAVRTRSGRVFAGSYLENAAFNPSLSPLQSAMVNLVLANEEPAAIERVVLVESGDATISQRASTEIVMSAIAPSVKVEHLRASA